MNGGHCSDRRGSYMGSLPKSLRSLEKGKITADGNMTGNRGIAPGRTPVGPLPQTEGVAGATTEEEGLVLLSQKQAQLETIFARHDDMIRELYHMDEYLLMLAYDPQVAKVDNSSDFTKYKAPYDLLEKVRPDVGPSRRTRGMRSEQLSIVPGLTSSPKKPLLKSASRAPKGRLAPDAIQEIISTARVKPQDKVKNAKPERHQAPEEIGFGSVDGTPVSNSVSKKLPEKEEGGRTILLPIDVSLPIVTAPVILPVRSRTKDSISAGSISNGRPLKKRGASILDKNRESISAVLGRRSGRLRGDAKQEPPAKRVKTGIDEPTDKEPVTVQSPAHPPKLFPKLPNLQESAFRISSPKVETPISTPTFKIKRIKLLVRRPPPALTHPRQRPPAPKFNSSLRDFLASYRTLENEPMDSAKLAHQAFAEARTREKEAAFGRQGRFIPGTDALFGTQPSTTPYDPPKRITRDIWDDIVDIVCARRTKVPKKAIGQQVTTQIASKVQAYWDTQELRRGKARAQEEKRLKALAKATVKIVNTEWKKAVYHVREQERLKHEAEERRRGHEHLDAILDQSGQLLETQHGELKRTRTRSKSGDLGLDWGEQSGSEDGIGEESGEETDGEAVNEPDGTSEPMEGDMGKGDLSSTREPSRVEEEEDNEEEQDTTHLLLGPLSETREGVGGFDTPPQVLTEDDTSAGDGTPSSPRVVSFAQDSDDVEQVGSRASPYSQPPPPPVELTEHPPSSIQEPIGTSNLSAAVKETPVSSFPDGGTDDGRATKMEEEEGDADLHVEEEEEGGEEEEKAEGLEGVAEPRVQEEEVTTQEVTATREDGTQREVEEEAEVTEAEVDMPDYLRPFAVSRVEWSPEEKIKPPLLLRGVLRPYQHAGLEWLASLHLNNLNGILADEMGLGKTIQTIALLAHLACDRGIWGPHLIIVPTSVLLNWEMEFKKFLPGFKVLSYHGTTKRRKELRQGWNDKHHFNVCITSYTLASRDAHIFKRKPWYYMILDEAHMIKNFKSQRWNILLMFRSFRRLLLTGTPLQNNLTELWALLQFLMSGSNFANLKEFGDWFSNPLEKAIELGSVLDDENIQRVTKLHTVLRPYLLRRLKRDVEKELPSKFEHLVLCPLSKRQRFLYDEFISRAQTRDDLESGVYHKIANVLMQLRKVCNHPDLFEVRPIVTSFAMPRSAVADFEIKELLIRRQWLEAEDEKINLDLFGYQFVGQQDKPLLTAVESRRLSATPHLLQSDHLPNIPPPKDTRTVSGYQQYQTYLRESDKRSRSKHITYLNKLKCSRVPIYSSELLSTVGRMYRPLLPLSAMDLKHSFMEVQPVHRVLLSYSERVESVLEEINRFTFVTPPAVALDLPYLALKGFEGQTMHQPLKFDQILHPVCVKLQIAFPDPSLLQYDCGKLQELKKLLQEKKAGGHRVLIFTQMTRILDILEIFLSLHGYLYLRLDGATKIEDRQYITERFNADARVFCFIASSRSGGVGINLTGADTVVFYDSDFNPQMDKQCEDRAHRIGQIRDVHIYRFVSQHTVEEAMLRKANQKRSLDDIVIQKGEFDWRTIFSDEADKTSSAGAVTALTKALGEFEDAEDAYAAAIAAREEYALEGADNDDFGVEGMENTGNPSQLRTDHEDSRENVAQVDIGQVGAGLEGTGGDEEGQEDEEGGAIVDYMLATVQRDYDFFKDWRL